MNSPLFNNGPGSERPQHESLEELSLPSSPEDTPRARLVHSLASRLHQERDEEVRTLLEGRIDQLLSADSRDFPLRGDFRAADVIMSLGFKEETRCAELSEEGDFIVLGSRDGEVRVISLQERDVAGRLKILSSCTIPCPVTTLSLTPGERTLVVGGEDHSLRIYSLEETLSGFSLLDGKPYHRPRELFRSYFGSTITSLAHDPGGVLLAVGSGLEEGGLVRLIDISRPSSPVVLLEFGVQTQRPALAFSPDGEYLAVGGARTFLIPTGQDRWSEGVRGLEERADALAFSPDGNYLAVGGGSDHNRERIRVFRLGDDLIQETPLLIASHRVYQPIRSLTFSPNGDVLSVGLEAPFMGIGRLMLFELSPNGFGVSLKEVGSCSLLRPLRGQSFSGNGEKIALVGEDKIVWIFGMRDPYLPYEI